MGIQWTHPQTNRVRTARYTQVVHSTQVVLSNGTRGDYPNCRYSIPMRVHETSWTDGLLRHPIAPRMESIAGGGEGGGQHPLVGPSGHPPSGKMDRFRDLWCKNGPNVFPQCPRAVLPFGATHGRPRDTFSFARPCCFFPCVVACSGWVRWWGDSWGPDRRVDARVRAVKIRARTTPQVRVWNVRADRCVRPSTVGAALGSPSRSIPGVCIQRVNSRRCAD